MKKGRLVVFGLVCMEAVWGGVLNTAWAEPNQILIVGLTSEEGQAWNQFLQEQKIKFRIDYEARSFYVEGDPIQILEKAKSVRDVAPSAQRALRERELEREILSVYPQAVDPRVCLAYPDEAGRIEESAQPIAMVYAGGISKTEKRAIQSLVAKRTGDIPAGNVFVIGTDWRPWPGYEKSTGPEDSRVVKGWGNTR